MKLKRYLVRGTFSFEVAGEDEEDAKTAVESMQNHNLPHVKRIAYIEPNEVIEL